MEEGKERWGGGRESCQCSEEDERKRRKYNKKERKDSRLETWVKGDEEENRVHEAGVKEEKRGRQEEKSEGGRGLGKLKWEGRTTRQLTHYHHNTFIYVYFDFVTFYA